MLENAGKKARWKWYSMSESHRLADAESAIIINISARLASRTLRIHTQSDHRSCQIQYRKFSLIIIARAMRLGTKLFYCSLRVHIARRNSNLMRLQIKFKFAVISAIFHGNLIRVFFLFLLKNKQDGAILTIVTRYLPGRAAHRRAATHRTIEFFIIKGSLVVEVSWRTRANRRIIS